MNDYRSRRLIFGVVGHADHGRDGFRRGIIALANDRKASVEETHGVLHGAELAVIVPGSAFAMLIRAGRSNSSPGDASFAWVDDRGGAGRDPGTELRRVLTRVWKTHSSFRSGQDSGLAVDTRRAP